MYKSQGIQNKGEDIMGENNQILQEMIKELQKKLPDGRPIGITFST